MSSDQAAIAEAQDLINQIVKAGGYVREETLKTMTREARREVEEALLIKDKRIGSSVLTLAKNLYTSNARFVFELLQNADDNQYSTAESENQPPFVAFRVFPGKIVVECNEDGFTERHLRAICDIGNSSKTGSQGYIGEKGIGFKSVFMAAWKVHIQSGYFSFRFVHRKGDSGMGMIKPVWENPVIALPHRGTFITLFLHECEGADESTRKNEEIRKQLLDLQAPLLHFLRNIRRIAISVHTREGEVIMTKEFSIQSSNALTKIVTLSTRVDRLDPEVHNYHVTKYMATGLARSENRTLSEAEESSKSYVTSEIVLAFPVSNDLQPVIEPQKVFAFLPMRRVGFNFLIQADFVTQANREDIVTDSPRNRGLRKGIAQAFVSAMTQLSRHAHESLRYSWVRYLPRNGHHWDPFWQSLVDDISHRIREEDIFRTHREDKVRPIGDLRFWQNLADDEIGNPLFRDSNPEIYLSASYSAEDKEILREYGLKNLYMDEIIQLAALDSASNTSRLRGHGVDDSWYSTASVILSFPFEMKRQDAAVKRVRHLKMIPLANEEWTSAKDGKIFHPMMGDTPVPDDLRFRLVHPNAIKNKNRRKLFEHLGMARLERKAVRERILSIYQSIPVGWPTPSPVSVPHLRFLYLTHRPDDMASNKRKTIPIKTISGVFAKRPGEFDIYVRDEEPYGAFKLLDWKKSQQFPVCFIDEQYLHDPPAESKDAGISWRDWLYNYIGLRRHVRLLDRKNLSVSQEALFISEQSPDQFMGYLKHVWHKEMPTIAASDKALRTLRNVEVPCGGGEEARLCETYLPLPPLKATCARFFDSPGFPFLELPGLCIQASWLFLTQYLGVRFEDNVGFRLRILEAIKLHTNMITPLDDMHGWKNRLAHLYLYIEAGCLESQHSKSVKAEIVEYFEERRGIWTGPAPGGNIGGYDRWVSPSRCLWNAPSNWTSKKPLRWLLTEAFQDAGVDLQKLLGFFKGTLEVRDFDYIDCITELRAIRDRQDAVVNVEAVRRVYRFLYDCAIRSNSAMVTIKEAFQRYDLVCVNKNGCASWHRPSSCVWSSIASIDGKIPINSDHADLQHFFVDILDVQSIDAAMIYNELIEISSKNPPIDKVKALLKAFATLLGADAHSAPAPGRILDCRILPVSTPTGVLLCSGNADFVIADRQGHFVRLANRVKTLDFTMQEICRLAPFIMWAGLEMRYLSRCVRESSRVAGVIERPISERNRDIKTKAYGLLRVAAKYNSPRFEDNPEALYDLLHNSVTVETDGISSTLCLSQDGVEYEEEIGRSELHIEDRDGTLKIYVPEDEIDRQICFKSDLPRGIFSWLMTPPGLQSSPPLDGAAVHVISILLDCSLSAVARLLEKEGVPDIDMADRSAEHAAPAGVAGQPLTRPPITGVPSTSARQRVASSSIPRTRSSESDISTPGAVAMPSEIPDYPTPMTNIDSEPEDAPSAESLLNARRLLTPERECHEMYRRLLERVVAIARETTIPRFGTTHLAFSLDNLAISDDSRAGPARVWGFSDSENRRRIGAAGELFVFECLNVLRPRLPGFNQDNWRSTIKYFARAHPEYADMGSFSGRETSDIVYNDTSGMFTDFLINAGYLAGSWQGKTPNYLIEAKSTMDECETPFFASDGQYNRMLENTNGVSGTENQGVIYALFRVFNLGKESMGLKIFIDPEQQRSRGVLRFTADKYTITPGPRRLAYFVPTIFRQTLLSAPQS